MRQTAKSILFVLGMVAFIYAVDLWCARCPIGRVISQLELENY